MSDGSDDNSDLVKYLNSSEGQALMQEASVENAAYMGKEAAAWLRTPEGQAIAEQIAGEHYAEMEEREIEERRSQQRLAELMKKPYTI